MTRTTRKDLDQLATIITNRYHAHGSPLNVRIESAYGHPRAELYDGDTCEHNITSRDRAGIVYMQLLAYNEGLRSGLSFRS